MLDFPPADRSSLLSGPDCFGRLARSASVPGYRTSNRKNNMKTKTLKELIIEAKCRKGEAHGTTKRGAYWCPFVERGDHFACIGGGGSDGIGQNAPNVDVFLDFRHYRDGTVSAVITRSSWHQNHGTSTAFTRADNLLGCTNVEEVIVALKGMEIDESPVLRGFGEPKVTKALVDIGVPLSAPAPDEVEEEPKMAPANPVAMTSHPSFRPMPRE